MGPPEFMYQPPLAAGRVEAASPLAEWRRHDIRETQADVNTVEGGAARGYVP